jgi:hypothetical protein
MRQTFGRRSFLGYCAAGVGAALTAFTSRGRAASTTFKTTMNAASEVPATTSTGTGAATITLDPATNKITWNVTFSGLTGPATAVHIHGPAPAGKNAGVMIWLSTKGQTATSPVTGSGDLTAAQVSDLTNGQCYVNVHTTANPGGEIRGQLAAS